MHGLQVYVIYLCTVFCLFKLLIEPILKQEVKVKQAGNQILRDITIVQLINKACGILTCYSVV